MQAVPMTGVTQRLVAGHPGAGDRRGRLLAYWLSPAGLVIGAATLLALVVRGFLLTRPHFLNSGAVEYDDGVYLGEAIRLLHGDLPYRDYALIQPPGIALAMLPEAIIAKLTSATAGLAVARMATVAASTACVAPAGNPGRHPGPPPPQGERAKTARPWASRRTPGDNPLSTPGKGGETPLSPPSGKASGTGTRLRRLRWYLPALAAGFVVPIAALAWAAPLEFVRSTLLYQATRIGQPAPLALRLDHLTALIPVLDGNGLGVAPGSWTLFQADATAAMEVTTAWAAAPFVGAVIRPAPILIPHLPPSR